jgi:predicted permease
MDILFQDIRYSLRIMRRNMAFTIVAVLTLALGIGANTAIFSIVNAVLLRSLPYRDPDTLVKVSFSNPGVGLHDIRFSYPEFDDVRTRSGAFEEISVVWPSSGNLTGASQPERLELLAVSPNYFSMLGAVPQEGRLFGEQDFVAGFAQAAVISDGLWSRSYGRSPGVLGKSLRIDNDPYTIVGVLPPGFRHPGQTISGDVEVWLAAGFSADPFSPDRGQRELPGAMARLKRGMNLEQARSKLDTLARNVRADYPNDYPQQAQWSVEIQPLQESLVGSVRPMLLVLMGAVALIILIASVNIANLLLARASGRQREMGVRLALGASRSRTIRQMLTESLVLSLIAGVTGVVAAVVSLKFIVQFVPAGIPRLTEVRVNWTVLLFAMLLSILTGIIFGLAPALQSVKSDLLGAIREGARGSGTSVGAGRLRSALIMSELALAVVLMVGAGLLLRTLWGLLQGNPGFNPSGVVATSLWLPVPNDPKTDTYDGLGPQTTFVREVLRRVSAIPGVEKAGITSVLPAATMPTGSVALTVEDRAVESTQDLRAEVIRVSPGYFEVMQSALISGRFFNEGDEAGKLPVAIIDQTTAGRYWPGKDAIGRRLRLGRAATLPWFTIVGIIKDIKHDGLDKDGVPHIYASVYQRVGRTFSVVLRTPLSPSTLAPQIRHEIQSVDPNLPVFNLKAMKEVVDRSLSARRFSAQLVGVFAGLALLLASIGIYGLLAYMVSQRSHEIGIRMALGAQPNDVLRLFLIKGVMLSAAGIAAGLIIAALIAPAIRSLLYAVHPVDPLVFLGVPLVLLLVAAVASYVPARRAMKVDPMSALREG